MGGGAAGFFAAIAFAEANPNLHVILLEATPRLLTKVKISGGGRCNVTHHCFDPAQLVRNYPRGHKELRGPFSKFQPKDTVAWFEERGVALKAEDDGRMFPVTDQSETIIVCLKEASAEAGVEVRTGALVKAITCPGEGTARFRIELQKGDELAAESVLLASGSAPLGYRMAVSLGHTIVPPVPSLFTFEMSDARLTDLSGVSFPNVELALSAGEETFRQHGPLLITHWGVSGPAVLKLSAWGARALHQSQYRGDLQVNFLPGKTRDWAAAELRQMRSTHRGKQPHTMAPFNIPKRYWQRLIEIENIAVGTTWAAMGNERLQHLAEQLTGAHFRVEGKGQFKEEFVTAGGIELREVDFRTMQSRLCPGLFFAGEILDIDGITGGFNFQNAWTTGWLAGNAMAQDSVDS